MCAVRPYHIVAIWCLIHSTSSQRRIHDGHEVTVDMPFAVYFLKAGPSERKYRGWTCGGSIVTPEFIITSAACVEDVKHMYAIAGYKKFVEAENIDQNTCTKNRKKKVVLTCVPKLYELEFTKIEKWATTDIAVVKVESPYDFNDESYKRDCSYIPKAIRVNYELKYQKPDTEAMVLGWGHTEKWRAMNDYESYNSQNLRYASTSILHKSQCKKEYTTEEDTPQNKALLRIIDKYMICTLHGGNLDDQGELVVPSIPDMEGCVTKQEQLNGVVGATCEDEESVQYETIEEQPTTESKTEVSTESHIIVPMEKESVEETDDDDIELDEGKAEIVIIGRKKIFSMPKVQEIKPSRRAQNNSGGICQNDHGGPLLTWVGGHQVLIGVASVFKLVNGNKCAGPYLFTSTQCNGKFLDCLINGDLNKDANERRRRSCDGSPEEKGFYTIERRISWMSHPDGPAENERFAMRPQVPLSTYHRADGGI